MLKTTLTTDIINDGENIILGMIDAGDKPQTMYYVCWWQTSGQVL